MTIPTSCACPSAVFGPNTAGTLELYFDGSDVGLTTDGEDIDSLSALAGGGLLIGFLDATSVTGATAKDEDLWLFQPASLGQTTAGAWSLYFSGSKVGLGQLAEDVWAAAFEPATGRLALTSPSETAVGNLIVGTADVYACALTGVGAATACVPPPTTILDGAEVGFGSEIIDALHILNE